MKVCKFGGSSLADAAQLSKVCDIIRSDPARRLIVVSAPGKRSADDVKVTDLLIACADARLTQCSGEEELQRILERYAQIQREMGAAEEVMADIERNLRGCMAASMEHRERYLDGMKAAGEDNHARLIAAILQAQGLEAVYVNPGEAGMCLSAEYGKARLLPGAQAALGRLRERRGILVFPGFFGYTPEGEVVTFSRGGSDITGSILAAAVGAEVYENFTDVDSVFAADPRVVPHAQAIAELTYREMRELAYAGFSVLHDEAVIPAVRAGIPICIKNTNRPDAPGTRIVPRHKVDGSRVVGIASADGFCAVYLSKYLMNREIGFGRKLLQILEEECLSFEHAPSGIDNMSVILSERGFGPDVEAHVRDRVMRELHVEDVDVERGLALIMIVGEGMRYAVGLAAAATAAMAQVGVNIEMMNQGPSEISMMFGVKAADRERAVRALYQAFFTGDEGVDV